MPSKNGTDPTFVRSGVSLLVGVRTTASTPSCSERRKSHVRNKNGNAPPPDKVAKVEEVTAKLNEARAVFVKEYRGITVGQIADLRTPLRAVGAEHKVYKNTLVKLAATAAGMEGLTEHLTGPTALTFVTGDIAASAKALTEQAKATPALVVKGGMMGQTVMSADDVRVLADLPPRDVSAGAVRRRTASTAGQDGRSAPGAATQLRVRPQRPRSEAGRSCLNTPHLWGASRPPQPTEQPNQELIRRTPCPRMKSSTQFPT